MSDTATVVIAGIAAVQVVALALIAALITRTNHNVGKIEKATNSMKDALVLATEKEALQRGHNAGVKEQQQQQQQQKKEQ
jgi:hypothetical protein